MTADVIFPVDMRTKRRNMRFTQERLAQEIGFTRETVSRVERRETSIPMEMAVRCADIFGSLTLETNGQTFVICRPTDFGPGNGTQVDDIPNTEQHERLDGVEHYVHASNQVDEARAALKAALADTRTWRPESVEGRPGRVAVVKELLDVREAADGAIEDIRTADPEAYEEGEYLHLVERGLVEEAGGFEQVA